jgi:hypothetical protein
MVLILRASRNLRLFYLMTMKSLKSSIFFLSTLTLLFVTSCELLEGTDTDSGPNIAEGLKEALRVGTDSATYRLASVDGYLKDQAVKILLPDELSAQIAAFKAIEVNIAGLSYTGEDIYSTGIPLFNINSLQAVEDDLIMGINRAAESAAKEAGPIFFGAITSITISDANNILFGADDAATLFLKDNTFDALFTTYEPKINNAISNVKVGNNSVEDVYSNFINSYNDILNKEINIPFLLNTSILQLTDLSTIQEADLSSFATTKGLDGLFLKIEKEEANIRENPFNRVTEILKDVFGLLD